MLTEKYEQALVFAKQLHNEQKRKGTDIPYISHLIAVSSLVLEAGGDENEAIGALLHDSIEDCPKDYPGGVEGLRKYISNQFGSTVLDIVEHCSDSDVEPKPPWRERKQAYIDAVSSKPKNALLVSCADKLHNARAILSDYRMLGESLWERFNAGRESLWYYRSLVIAFKSTSQIPQTLLNELELTVRQIHDLASEEYLEAS